MAVTSLSADDQKQEILQCAKVVINLSLETFHFPDLNTCSSQLAWGKNPEPCI